MPRSKSKPLPAASLYLLLALLAGENHGYTLMRLVEEQSDGAVRMGPGTLYGTLNRLRDDQLIEETTNTTERDDGERRRYYRLTGSGQQMAVAELDRLRSLVARFDSIPGLGGAPGMTRHPRQVAMYRRLTALYPRSFRVEYRDDLVGMFAAQLSDESAVRVWCRAARDLATTVPTQRLEARMQRRSMNTTALFCGAVAVTGLLSAALFGTSPVSILLLVVVLLASVLTVLADRGGHSVSAERAVRRWWQFLAAGAGLLVLVVIVENSPFRTLETSSNGRWYASFLTVVLSVVLLSTGLILAIGRLFDRRTPNV